MDMFITITKASILIIYPFPKGLFLTYPISPPPTPDVAAPDGLLISNNDEPSLSTCQSNGHPLNIADDANLHLHVGASKRQDDVILFFALIGCNSCNFKAWKGLLCQLFYLLILSPVEGEGGDHFHGHLLLKEPLHLFYASNCLCGVECTKGVLVVGIPPHNIDHSDWNAIGHVF